MRAMRRHRDIKHCPTTGLLHLLTGINGQTGNSLSHSRVHVLFAYRAQKYSCSPILAYVPQTQPQAVQQPGRGGRAHGLIGGGGSGSGLGVGLGACDGMLCAVPIHMTGIHPLPFRFVAAGTAGLVGGALLDEGYEHHENQEAYDQS